MVRYYRRIIRIAACQSPNVILGMWQLQNNKPITDEIVVPGVLQFRDYLKRRETWDKVRQCICLDGEFYEGSEVLLYPPEWLNRAEAIAARMMSMPRQAKAIGIDPAEGGDKTTMAVIDEYGLLRMISKQTPDTSVIVGEALALMMEYKVPPERVMFDSGGGGKQHADVLRSKGYNVATVAFGEAVARSPRRGVVSRKQRVEDKEERYIYRNRRAQMYGTLREMLDPGAEGHGFGIPVEFTELRRQLSPIPLQHDGEGRLFLPPKSKKSVNSNERTLTEILGCSPDEADALVIAIHAYVYEPVKVVIGAVPYR